jgi:quercetin dioxygenase-like cupin family protein
MQTAPASSRTTVLTSIVVVGGLLWALGDVIVPRMLAQQASNFVGGAPTRLEAEGVSTSRLRFAAGSRSNWHSHAQGQLLMVQEGRARTQERGKPVREILPGQPWFTPASVEHWHGAAPEQELVQLTISMGAVKWLEPVGDKEYRAALVK